MGLDAQKVDWAGWAASKKHAGQSGKEVPKITYYIMQTNNSNAKVFLYGFVLQKSPMTRSYDRLKGLGSLFPVSCTGNASPMIRSFRPVSPPKKDLRTSLISDPTEVCRGQE